MTIQLWPEGYTTHDEDSATTYRPFIGSEQQVGYLCTKWDNTGSIKSETYIYFNPSGGSDDGVATVFVYQDKTGEDFIEAHHYYNIWEDESES